MNAMLIEANDLGGQFGGFDCALAGKFGFTRAIEYSLQHLQLIRLDRLKQLDVIDEHFGRHSVSGRGSYGHLSAMISVVLYIDQAGNVLR